MRPPKNSVAHAAAALLISLLLAVGAHGATSQSGDDRPYAPPLWQVTNAEHTAYLLGSIHFGDTTMYPLPATTAAAIESAQTIAVEIDLHSVTANEQRRVVRRYGVLPQGQKLSTQVGEVVWTKVTESCRELALDCAQLEPLRPWLAALRLAVKAISTAGYDASKGVDQFIMQRMAQKAKIVALETFEGQISLMASIDGADGRIFMDETAQSIEEVREQLDGLFAAWRVGDDRALDRFLNNEFRDSRINGIYDAMIVNRNKRMAQKIDILLRQNQRLMVVVGAAHLVGPDSIPKLLEGSGWALKRVSP
ncbi:MAG: TraB/GumN family protein [Chromatiales bacterium]|nr:TraB/GumN family protein [Chromatiales bacterium]